MKKVILVRCGEIILKGLNKPFFEKALMSNIKRALNGLSPISVTKSQSRIYINPDDEDFDMLEAATRLISIPGIVSVSVVDRIPVDYDEIKKTCARQTEKMLAIDGKKTFKVFARRGDKSFKMKSLELCADIGAFLLEMFPQLSVDIHKPEFTIFIEIRDYAYIYSEIIHGTGGLPVGTNGKAMLLLSGGIDSPVAGWMIAKRGVEISAVHFYSYPYTSERSREKVVDLAKILIKSTLSMKLFIVPFTELQVGIYEKCPAEYTTIIMRRHMMRIAQTLALRNGDQALITGESIGQVASQTMHGLAATDDSVDLPVFRPLIGMDKNDVVALARKIGTYDTSILPYEDCCTVFTAKHPLTRPSIDKIKTIEASLDNDVFMEKALNEAEMLKFEYRGGVAIENRQGSE